MSQAISGVIIGGGNIYSSPATKYEFLVNTTNKFTFKVVQSANQIITSTPVGRPVNNSDGTISLALTDTTTISPNTNYIPGTIQRSYDDSTHTYTVTATDAEPIDGLVQDGWSVVYQKQPDDDTFYSKADYTGTDIYYNKLQGNILIGGMKVVSFDWVSYDYPRDNNNILKFKNSFLTSAGNNLLTGCSGLAYVELPNLISARNSLLSGCSGLTSVELPNLTSAGNYMLEDCPSLTSVELPNLTSAGNYMLSGCSGLTSVELPNLTSAGNSLLEYCSSLTSVELPNLTSAGNSLLTFVGNSSSTINFIDFGHLTKINNDKIFYYARVMVFRADTVPTNFTQSQLSYPVLYIVPSALVDTYKSKVRSKDYVTALEKSPFADGKTVCGNNMKTAYFRGNDGENPGLGEGIMLKYFGHFGSWNYITDFSTASVNRMARAPQNPGDEGYVFLSKLTKERGYTIPTRGIAG